MPENKPASDSSALAEQLRMHAQWRAQMLAAIASYQAWSRRYQPSDPDSMEVLTKLSDGLQGEQMTLAFAADGGYQKAALINALLFADTHIYPSFPASASPCPIELGYDPAGSYIRLLPIETRLQDSALLTLKQAPAKWQQIDLDCTSPTQLQTAFKALVANKKVTKAVADKLGLGGEEVLLATTDAAAEQVAIPCWRYARISLPHPLLQAGLTVLDPSSLSTLRTEPELTLSILPSAQAIIFVLPVARELSKNELELWHNHVCSPSRNKQQNVAVAIANLDTLRNQFATVAEYQQSIAQQLKHTAATLNLNEAVVFPPDTQLLESHLLDVLVQHGQLMQQTVAKKMDFLLAESTQLTVAKSAKVEQQLAEFKKVDADNVALAAALMAETRDRKNTYQAAVENFKASQKVFSVQAKTLLDSFAERKINAIIRDKRRAMVDSLTTYGIKQNIGNLFAELRNALQDLIDSAQQANTLAQAIHKKFRDDYGFRVGTPQVFSSKQYQFELEQIFERGEAFRVSIKTAISGQGTVINRLHSTLLVSVQELAKHAHYDAQLWSNSVLTPLIQQLKEQQKQLESRLHILNKINDSKGSVPAKIAALEAEAVLLKKRGDGLMLITQAMPQPPTICASNV